MFNHVTLRGIKNTLYGIPIALLITLVPSTVIAHGFGERYALPVPLWLYLYGASVAVILSFAITALFFSRKESGKKDYPRYNLLKHPWIGQILLNVHICRSLRSISILILVLIISAGLLGSQRASDNFAPAFIWIVWWVGLGILVTSLGNIWHLVNPWIGIHDAIVWLISHVSGEENETTARELPNTWGILPALSIFIIFVWIELIYNGSSIPSQLALLTSAYSVYTVGGMLLFGKNAWLNRGEVFSVYFRILSRLSIFEFRINERSVCLKCSSKCQTNDECIDCYECFSKCSDLNKEINLRLPASGLTIGHIVQPGELLFILTMLASVSFDGFLITPLWMKLYIGQRDVFIENFTFFQTLGLAGALALFSGLFLFFLKISHFLSGKSSSRNSWAATFIYTLVPIAAAYNIAHYFTFVLVPGQRIISLASDPFGYGLNLFGTASYQVNDSFMGAAFVWYTQVLIIILGHVLAVIIAHVVAVQIIGDHRRAMLSQFPTLVLMIIYTIGSLWIIAQDTTT
jgi:hypothetical protein